jgi:hypothetical protein
MSVAAFVLAFERFGVIPAAGGAVKVAGKAMETLSRKDLNEDEKEAAAQTAALSLLRAFASLTLRGVAIAAVAILPAVAIQWLGFAPVSATLDLLATWPAILIVSVFMTVIYFVRRPSK